MSGTSPSNSRHFGWSLVRTVFGLGIFCALVCVPAARADEFSQTSTYSIELVRGTVVVDTRVGDILIEGWDKERVEVEAEKVVRAGSEKKAQSLFGRIRVELGTDEEERTVYLKTVYPSRSLWRPFRGESRLSVNFRIKVPFHSNLVLKCVNGDVRIRGVRGNEQLKVNYGSVEINVPSVWDLRSLQAHTWLGYVQSDLKALPQSDAGLSRRVLFWNPEGKQEIKVNIHMGGVFVYGNYD